MTLPRFKKKKNVGTTNLIENVNLKKHKSIIYNMTFYTILKGECTSMH